MLEPKTVVVLATVAVSSLMTGAGLMLSGDIPTGAEMVSPAIAIGVLVYFAKQAERREERMNSQFVELLRQQQQHAESVAIRQVQAIEVQTQMRDALHALMQRAEREKD